jgi:hypothetical protein
MTTEQNSPAVAGPVEPRVRLTPAQHAALCNLVAGRESWHGLRGRSAHGGHSWTIVSLRKNGLIDANDSITEAGVAAVTPNAKLTRAQLDAERNRDAFGRRVE